MSELHKRLVERFGNRPISQNSLSTVFDGNHETCPTCKRRLEDLAVLNKNGEILCSLHNHHDHIEEYVWQLEDRFSPSKDWHYWFNTVGYLITRFQYTRICSFCNEAEGKAKMIAGADRDFSFTPGEIEGFVTTDGPGHVLIDDEKARETWSTVKENVKYRKALADRIVELAVNKKIGMKDIPLDVKIVEPIQEQN